MALRSKTDEYELAFAYVRRIDTAVLERVQLSAGEVGRAGALHGAVKCAVERRAVVLRLRPPAGTRVASADRRAKAVTSVRPCMALAVAGRLATAWRAAAVEGASDGRKARASLHR